ncbi:MAG: DUF1570 domain-containing protein [Thermoguttaceae bacterium]|jgi:hypothetical protein
MPLTTLKSYWFWLATFVVAMACWSAEAMDHVTLLRERQTLNVDGRIVLTAQDGGLLFLARDGALWRILPTEIIKHTTDDAPFRAYAAEQMTKSIMADLPRGFEVYKTAHYMIVYDTSRAYAQWCGALFERLYTAFRNAWSHQGFEIVEPEFRLVAVIFSEKASYVKYSQKELGDAADSIFGYYNMESNRMIMYDLAGVAVNRPGRTVGISQINQFLASPNAPGTVSTIVHEATHQIAFNSGLHQRLSDCPKWFSEGIAMYCETPDLGKTKGWAGIGVVNRDRLAQFWQYQQQRPTDSLKTLISSDERLVNAKQAVNAYAESWALTYYLIHKHSKQYVAYLRVLSRKRPLEVDEKAKRVAEFEKEFGPVDKLNADFINYMHTYLP